MTLYVRDLPIFYLPFSVFPNKNGNRISGWIMPTFGHRSSSGTYLDNLGYYYVLNDYSDYTFLFDIQDKKGIIANNDALLNYGAIFSISADQTTIGKQVSMLTKRVMKNG